MHLHASAKLGLAGRLALVRAVEDGLSFLRGTQSGSPAGQRTSWSVAPLAVPASGASSGADRLKGPLARGRICEAQSHAQWIVRRWYERR
jgi:hypothetical protein